MKTIEEKARAYDEAVNKPRRFIEQGVDPLITRADVQDFFPELAESEDEKVMKEIIDLIMQPIWKTEKEFYRRNELCAWIKKQGQVKESHISQHENRTCEENSNSLTYKDERIRKEIINYFQCQSEEEPTRKEIHNKWIAWLENIPYTIDHEKREGFHLGYREALDYAGGFCVLKKNEQRMVSAEKSLGIDSDTYNKIVDECILGEQKSEENKGNIGVISANPKWSEENEPQKELVESYLAKFDEKFPILPTLKGKRLADYKNFLNRCQQIFRLKYWGIRPTQAKLFEKLSLLWAAWGAEHLQGLGQTDGDMDDEILWSEEDERNLQGIIDEIEANKNEAPDYDLATYDRFLSWLHSLQDRVQPQPKQEWKQENTGDLTAFENAMMHIGGSFFGQHAGLDPNDTNSIKEQANLLLELVPSKEWSEEDKQHIDSLLKRLDALCRNKFERTRFAISEDRDWLKSLRPQNRWKPSDEHISLLQAIINEPNNAASESCQIVLKDILEQLKKLKEE